MAANAVIGAKSAPIFLYFIYLFLLLIPFYLKNCIPVVIEKRYFHTRKLIACTSSRTGPLLMFLHATLYYLVYMRKKYFGVCYPTALS